MAGMRIEAMRLVVDTRGGRLGRNLRFRDGLNVLRADNSSGKSTALQSIIYALGLEGMLSPTHRVPLPHAMTDSVPLHGQEHQVEESSVHVQVANSSGESIVVSRSVVSANNRDRRLITVTHGRSLTETGDFRSTDFFVRARGAAQNEAGFHRYLAEFLGLDLPRVTKMDNSEVPLYLETLFPYFFVEQKHGWSGIQARTPTYLGIREVDRRSAEFVLGLDVFSRILRRQRISSTLSELEAEWQTVSRQQEELAKASRVVLRDVPARIGRGLDEKAATPLVHLRAQWMPLQAAIDHLQGRLDVVNTEVPPVSEVAPALELRLPELEAGLRECLAIASALADERQELRERERQLNIRLSLLDEDLRRHKDSELLERFGSEHAHSLIAEHVCPTCHQDLADGSDISAHAMSIAENITFIQRQIKVFADSKADVERVAGAVDARTASLTEQIRSYRAEIRAARETLSSADSAPSVADISQRLELEQKLDELRRRIGEFDAMRETLRSLATRWEQQRQLLAEVRDDKVSPEDEARILAVERSVQQQLRRYGFDSLVPEEVAIDRVTYRPTHEGFDLGFDLSASDMIRVIWAYLFAVLNVGVRGGNHLGFLVFDEPRQQETARASYQALLAQASAEGAGGAQIIFATSETAEMMQTLLAGQEANFINLAPGEKLLLPD